MKRKRRIVQTVLVMTMIISMLNVPVFAKETVQTANEAVVASVIPDGFTLVGTFDRSPKTYYLGTFNVQSTSIFQLYLPNNGGKDWIQGHVEFSGSQDAQFDFINLSGENKTFDLSDLIPGVYEVRVYGYAFGTSNGATAYYKMSN